MSNLSERRAERRRRIRAQNRKRKIDFKPTVKALHDAAAGAAADLPGLPGDIGNMFSDWVGPAIAGRHYTPAKPEDVKGTWENYVQRLGGDPNSPAALGGAFLSPGPDLLKYIGGAAGVMAGAKAAKADLPALRRAKEMAERSADPDDIYEATGWFQAADGTWRWEIDDSGMKITDSAKKYYDSAGSTSPLTPGLKLSDAVDHPELFENYPEMMDLKFSGGVQLPHEPDPKYLGFYSDSMNAIHAEAKDPEDFLDYLAHEMNHSVQSSEGHARGGNPAELKRTRSKGEAREGFLASRIRDNMREIKRLEGDITLSPQQREAAIDSVRQRLNENIGLRRRVEKDFNLNITPEEEYKRLQGEVEARNAQARRNWDADLRKSFPPYATEDVPRSKQIPVYSDDDAAAAIRPTKPGEMLGTHRSYNEITELDPDRPLYMHRARNGSIDEVDDYVDRPYLYSVHAKENTRVDAGSVMDEDLRGAWYDDDDARRVKEVRHRLQNPDVIEGDDAISVAYNPANVELRRVPDDAQAAIMDPYSPRDFDTSRPLYHGSSSASEIHDFDPTRVGGMGSLGVWVDEKGSGYDMFQSADALSREGAGILPLFGRNIPEDQILRIEQNPLNIGWRQSVERIRKEGEEALNAAWDRHDEIEDLQREALRAGDDAEVERLGKEKAEALKEVGYWREDVKQTQRDRKVLEAEDPWYKLKARVYEDLGLGPVEFLTPALARRWARENNIRRVDIVGTEIDRVDEPRNWSVFTDPDDVRGQFAPQLPDDIQSFVPMRENPPTIPGTGAGGRVTVNDIGREMDALGGTTDPDDIISELVREIDYQMTQPETGLGWYDDDVIKLRDELEFWSPRFADPEDPLFDIWKGAGATHSYGTTVNGNGYEATRNLLHYLDEGKFSPRNPEGGKLWQGQTGHIKAQQLEMQNRLIGQMGERGWSDFLNSQHRIGDLRKLKLDTGLYSPKGNQGIAGNMNDLAWGSTIFGPKGGQFFDNLAGRGGSTIDMWATRTGNRIRGKMLGPDGKVVDAPRNAKERKQFYDWFMQAGKERGLSEQDAQAVLWYYEQGLFTDLGVASRPSSFSEAARRARPRLEEVRGSRLTP